MSLIEMVKSWNGWRVSLESSDRTEGWGGGSWWARPVFEPEGWYQKMSYVLITFCCIRKWKGECEVSSSGESRRSVGKNGRNTLASYIRNVSHPLTFPSPVNFALEMAPAWPFSLPLWFIISLWLVLVYNSVSALPPPITLLRIIFLKERSHRATALLKKLLLDPCPPGKGISLIPSPAIQNPSYSVPVFLFSLISRAV